MIRLEPISLAHAAAVQALAADPLIAATSNVPYPYPPDGANTWIRYTLAQRELGYEHNFAVLDGAQVVGVCGVLNISGTPRRGELGYWIGVPYWNRGYATVAARELVRRMFLDHAMDELYSSCLVRNTASFRVLEKTGFRHVGYGTHRDSKWGPEDRFALFELTKAEWLQLPTSNLQLPTPNGTPARSSASSFGRADSTSEADQQEHRAKRTGHVSERIGHEKS